MESDARVRILNAAVNVSLHAHANEKGMDPSVFSLAMSRLFF